jgi:AraC-like DNA-binding protein
MDFMDKDKELLETKRGYLKGDFEFFHLKDQKKIAFDYHYHDFNKIIIFISGNVTYHIEGKAYKLKPWDILLISNREIHNPIIDSGCSYERIILWINQAFLDKHSLDDSNLSTCFNLALKTNYNLLRLSPELIKSVRQNLLELEEAHKNIHFGSRILKNSLFMQLIVLINREFLGNYSHKDAYDIEYDERIDNILRYINDNLVGDLSIESLATKFYISKYHLMHKFKLHTGYSLHNYILLKRLIAANNLLKTGKPAMEVCIECGFGDYSSFVRAFKKMFGLSPKNHYNKVLQLEKIYESDGHF